LRESLLRTRQITPISGAASWERFLNAIRGADSRRLLREVAELSTRNAALVLNAELAARYGKRTGPRLPASSPGPNKVMRRVARRDLIIWDADARGYRMDPADAEIVLHVGRAGCRSSVRDA
jgi:hypothetical protein